MTSDTTYLAGMGAVPWADPDVLCSTYAALRVVADLLDGHVARCVENFCVDRCAEYDELIDWLHRAEELYACALEGIEPDTEAHTRLVARDEAEFARGFDQAKADRELEACR